MAGKEEITGSANQDLVYAGRFWARLSDGSWTPSQIENLKRQMMDTITDAAKSGKFHLLVQMGQPKISEPDREKLSAYRVLASEVGMEIGVFEYTARAGTVSAHIRPIFKQS